MVFVFLLFFLTALIPNAHPQTPPVVTSIVIENGTHTPEIRSVLPIREGDRFDQKKVEQAVSYLKKWGRFSEVKVEEERKGASVLLRFLLKEGYLISGIDIEGSYPYLSARLRRLITIHPADLYDPDTAQEQVEKLQSFYERRGYSGTKVVLDPKINEKKGTVDLVYKIEKGSRYRIADIRVTGATLFPHGWFVSQINPLLLYEPTRLRKSLEKIRRGYRKKGHLRARVRLKELKKDAVGKKINLEIEVVEGRRVQVLLEGNRMVSQRTLKGVMPILTEGGYGTYDIERSEQAILEQYRRLGFQETTVTSEKKDVGRGEVLSSLILFRISEGPQTRVKEVKIAGNREIGKGQIKRKLLTKENTLFQGGTYQPKTVVEDFNRLPQILKGYGALEAKALSHETVLNRFRDKATVTFSVEEGEITRIRSIRFVGNHHLSLQRLQKHLKSREGDPVRENQLKKDREELILNYANHGYPYAEVTLDMQREGGEAILTYQIEEGAEARFGRILIVGNERTDAKAIKRAFTFQEGDLFSLRKLASSERSLRRTPAFRGIEVETIGLAEKEPVVHILVKLEEHQKILVDLGVSYDTDRSFGGNLNLSHLNLLGTTRSGILKMTGGERLQRGEAILKDSHFLGFPLEASVSSTIEHQKRTAFETVDWGGALSLLKELTPQINLLGRYQIVRTFFTDVTDVATGFKEADHTTSKFSLSLSYDIRDSFADPRSGFVAFGGLDLSNKLIASNFNFIQPKGYFAHYLSLGGRITWLNYTRLETIEVFGGDTLARDQKLFLGGDFSIRGFNEDSVGPIGADGRPTGGLVLMVLTSELQTRLFQNFKLAFFLDNGSITDRFTDFGTGSLRHAAGVGLRYVTPVGPLRLDYGFKLDRDAGEPLSRLHFAFGYAF